MQLLLGLPEARRFVPDFQQTLATLGPLPALLYRALEFGALQNRVYFDTLSSGDRPRAYIREHIVRDMSLKFLRENNVDAREEQLRLLAEPLSAVAFRYGSINVRMLKRGRGGVLPGCGASKKRRQFYNQQPTWYIDGPTNMARSTRLNLVLLWDFDVNFNLLNLWLICPRTGGRTAADNTWFWFETLPYPTAAMDGPPPAPNPEEAERLLDELLGDDEEVGGSAEEA